MLTFYLFINFLSWFSDSNSKTEKVDLIHQEIYALMDSEPDSALALANVALKISEDISYDWGTGNSYYIMAYVYDELNQLDEALLFYLRSSHVFSQMDGHQKAEKNNLGVLLNVGSILRRNFKYSESIDFYEQGLAIADTISYPKNRLKLLYNLASVLQDKGDLPRATSVLDEAFSLATSLNDQGRSIKILNLMGIIHKDNKQYDLAREYYSRIIGLPFAESKNVGMAYHNLGVTFKEQGDFEKAKSNFITALNIKRGLENDQLLFTTLSELAHVSTAMRDWGSAEHYAKEAERIYPNVLNEPKTFEILHLLDTIYFVKGEFNVAQSYSSAYFSESKKFYERQKELIELKDRFKAGLLIEGFKQEVFSAKQRSRYFLIISLIVACSAAIFLILYIKRQLVRKSIEKALRDLRIVG